MVDFRFCKENIANKPLIRALNLIVNKINSVEFGILTLHAFKIVNFRYNFSYCFGIQRKNNYFVNKKLVISR